MFSLFPAGEFCLWSWSLESLASIDGVTALLDAGLAGVGDVAGTGIATASVGIIPACGEARTGPLGVFPILFCLGDLGLWVLGDNLGTGKRKVIHYILSSDVTSLKKLLWRSR